VVRVEIRIKVRFRVRVMARVLEIRKALRWAGREHFCGSDATRVTLDGWASGGKNLDYEFGFGAVRESHQFGVPLIPHRAVSPCLRFFCCIFLFLDEFGTDLQLGSGLGLRSSSWMSLARTAGVIQGSLTGS